MEVITIESKAYKQLINKFNKVYDLLENLIEDNALEEEHFLSEYISEDEAKKVLNYGTTWFWNLRKSGFPYYKLGYKVFYKKADFVTYLNDAGVN